MVASALPHELRERPPSGPGAERGWRARSVGWPSEMIVRTNCGAERHPNAAAPATAAPVLRALRRTRQVRQFTDEPVTETDLSAILEVARWSGSSMNLQPWTFIVIRDRADLERLAELAPYARHVAGAALAIAIAMNGDNPEWDAYDSSSQCPAVRSRDDQWPSKTIRAWC